MCSTLTGTPLAHEGGACFSLWWPLRYHKYHPKFATPFPLAFHAAPSWEIYLSLCIMLPMQSIQPETWLISAIASSFMALGVSLHGHSQWTPNHQKEIWCNLGSGMPLQQNDTFYSMHKHYYSSPNIGVIFPTCLATFWPTFLTCLATHSSTGFSPF